MVRLAWLNYSGVLEEQRMGQSEEIKESIKGVAVFGLILKNQLD